MRILISSSGPQDEANFRDSSSEQPIFHPQIRPDITSFNEQLFNTPSFRDLAAQRLSGAVKIPCVTYDGMGKIGSDPRWDIFYRMTKYLRQTFPKL